MMHIIKGNATPENARTYRLLPFEMPASASRLTVRYAFGEEIEQGSGVIDIGVFDERGGDFQTDGFRGWSGSARREFTISPNDATPGYTPGNLDAGTWHICLGLYEIAPDGCGYRVEVEIDTGTTPAEPIRPVLLALSDIPQPEKRKANGWYKGELHCHTYHSDGDSDPLDLIHHAEALGFDFLAITDHNVLSQQMTMRKAQTALMLIPGMEVTTYYGHWNVWGAHGWVDFRIQQEDDLRCSMETALERGYLVSCNHPKPYGPEWSFPEVDMFHCIEVWNGPWAFFNDQALAYWEAHLRAGKRYTAVGGSDTHFLKREHIAQFGQPATYIYCEGDPSPAKLLDSLKRGVVCVSDGPRLDLWCGDVRMGGTVTGGYPLTFHLQVTGAEGCNLQLYGYDGLIYEAQIETGAQTIVYTAPAGTMGYIRAQLVDGEQVRALTNPIYITGTGAYG